MTRRSRPWTRHSAFATEHELSCRGLQFRAGANGFRGRVYGAAKESVTTYLAVTSREAGSYPEAVTLLEDVDRILERRDAPGVPPEPGTRSAG